MNDGTKKAVVAATTMLLLAWLLTQRPEPDEAATPQEGRVVEQPARPLRTVEPARAAAGPAAALPPSDGPAAEAPPPAPSTPEDLPLFGLDNFVEVQKAYLQEPMKACFVHALRGGFLADEASSRIVLQLELAQGPESAFLDILNPPEDLPVGTEDLVTCLRNQLGQIRFSPASEPFEMDWPLIFSAEPGGEDTGGE